MTNDMTQAVSHVSQLTQCKLHHILNLTGRMFSVCH